MTKQTASDKLAWTKYRRDYMEELEELKKLLIAKTAANEELTNENYSLKRTVQEFKDAQCLECIRRKRRAREDALLATEAAAPALDTSSRSSSVESEEKAVFNGDFIRRAQSTDEGTRKVLSYLNEDIKQEINRLESLVQEKEIDLMKKCEKLAEYEENLQTAKLKAACCRYRLKPYELEIRSDIVHRVHDRDLSRVPLCFVSVVILKH
jgi:hypothetical protein